MVNKYKKKNAPVWKHIYKIILVKVIQKYNLYITNGEMPDYLSIKEK